MNKFHNTYQDDPYDVIYGLFCFHMLSIMHQFSNQLGQGLINLISWGHDKTVLNSGMVYNLPERGCMRLLAKQT